MKISRKYFQGFTLVELIIVITILAILATIAFVSFQNYTKDARDGNRITTLANLQKGLDLYFVTAGKYPLPNGNILTGTFNNTPLALVGDIGEEISSIIHMSKKPVDPISKNNYVYGVSENQKNYQITTILENLEGSTLIPKAYANGYRVYVVGNYKGLYKKSDNILYNLPSLIFTGSGNLTSLETFFVVDNGQNFPYKINTSFPDNTQTTTQVLKQLTGQDSLILTGVVVNKTNYKSFTGVLGYDEDMIGVVRFGEKEYYEKIKQTPSEDINDVIIPAICNPGESGASGSCKDSYWDKVVLLMHFDGEDGSTNFKDEKLHTASIYGNVKISSAASKYGGKSIYFDGNGDYLTIPYDQLLSIDSTTDKFTLEFYVNIGEIKDQCIIDNGSQYGQNQTNYTVWLSGGKLGTYMGQATTASISKGFSSVNSASIDTWYHYAFVKNGDTIKTFINGNLEKTDTLPFIPTMRTDRYLTIGNQSTTTPVQYHYKGYIDELRITNGEARYTENFTPPTQSFPDQ